jgi:molybdate transport system substrate-binding protein
VPTFAYVADAGTARQRLRVGALKSPRPSLGWASLALLGVLLASGCPSPAQPARPRVRVFAAASLAQVLEEATRDFEGAEVAINAGSSAGLARQIEQGAPADLFLSAHPRWVARLRESALLDAASERVLLGNRLVWIAPAGTQGTAPALGAPAPAEGRVALGDPEHVPAGAYGREALTALGWWQALESRCVLAADVRAALALVERGECAFGVVYASDAHASARVVVLGAFPSSSHTPIRYVAALTPRGVKGPARELLEHLTKRSEVFRAHGFAPITSRTVK